MQQTLKLTITAVGENDSVFLTPCAPVTLHESCIEDPEADSDGSEPEEELSGPMRSDGVPAPRAGEDVMVMIDD